jgi:MFS family permease
MAASIYAAAFLTSEYFQFALGEDPLATGLRLLPWTATPLVVAPVAGALSDRLGPRLLMVPGLLLQAGGYLWIAWLAGRDPGYGQLVVPFVVAGVGVSMVLPSSSTAALNAVPGEDLGKASGILGTLRQLGAVMGIAVTTAVFTGRGNLDGAAGVVSGFGPAIATAGAFSLLGAAVAALLGRRTAGPVDVVPVPGGVPAGVPGG